ncbi:acetate CoA-transferase subunit alpha [Denitromonas iodatirespirans]|uniref:Acetate CoA-transferase subunit alpha n=1 Tax=Denitromonas iodatirespirans TaxID=2795389 RepID=A0A944DB37_DENI1|nr:acetate CoA-transferase subunit alpha [Denitromonas iodatirespirans]MBT0961187.1 acetate CoA-transferase subunit alpha [Denitromonas iodatirespirans]
MQATDTKRRSKLACPDELNHHLRDGMRIMFGGFMGVGTPERLVAAILRHGARRLTLIGNDTAFPHSGVGPLIASGQVERVITSHIGTNPVTGRKMLAGQIAVELVPQGTLAERIRCGGAGLGGVLTPTGVGTMVAEGKMRQLIDGREYLLELPLRAELAILHAKRADQAGNLVYERAARNFNPLMALAADKVIAEVEEIVDTGEIDPDQVMTPGILVDHLILAESH